MFRLFLFCVALLCYIQPFTPLPFQNILFLFEKGDNIDGSAALQLGMRDYSAPGANTVSRRGLMSTAAAAAAFGLSLPSHADETISPAKAKVSGRTIETRTNPVIVA